MASGMMIGKKKAPTSRIDDWKNTEQLCPYFFPFAISNTQGLIFSSVCAEMDRLSANDLLVFVENHLW